MDLNESSLVLQQVGGNLANADCSVQEMAAKLADMKAKIGLVQQFFKDVMEKDTDYGIIPGTQKPTLYQPGADKLCSLYNFSKIIAEKQEHVKDYDTGHYDVTVKVRLVHRGSQVVVGEGEGSCSTYESKYRYRWVYERDIPNGVDKESLLCKEKEGRNGSKYKIYRIENEDLFSQWNTVLKMAIKRGYVAAVLASTGLSGLFSQEEEELDAWIEGEESGQEQPQQQFKQRERAASGNRSSNSKNAASDKQLKAIYAIAKGKGISSDEVKKIALQVTNKSFDTLSVSEASSLIEYLNKTEAGELKAIVSQEEFNPFSDDDLPPELFPDLGGMQV